MPFAQGVPTAEIQLGGRSYLVAWTQAAKRRFNEWLIGRGQDPKNPNAVLENLGAVLWASMDKDTRPTIAVEEIEEMIHPRNEAEIVDRFSALFLKSEPDPDPNAGPVAVNGPTTGKSASMNSQQSESTISV